MVLEALGTAWWDVLVAAVAGGESGCEWQWVSVLAVVGTLLGLVELGGGCWIAFPKRRCPVEHCSGFGPIELVKLCCAGFCGVVLGRLCSRHGGVRCSWGICG